MQSSNSKVKIINAVTVGAIVAIILIVALTILADLNTGLKDWLKLVFSHHWLGKGILAGASFVLTASLVSLLPTRVSEGRSPVLLWLLFAVATAGTAVILGFYLWEVFLKVA